MNYELKKACRVNQKTLMATFVAGIVCALLLVVAGETGLLPTGTLSDQKSAEFVVLSVMELLTICIIPLALRLFKFNAVKRRLTTAAVTWSLIRMAMLQVPMIANVLLYYLFMNPAFGYMAIILFLCMFFIVPTQSRCESEITK